VQAEDKAEPATSSSETSGHEGGEDGEEGPARRGLGGEAWEEQHTLSKTTKNGTRTKTQYQRKQSKTTVTNVISVLSHSGNMRRHDEFHQRIPGAHLLLQGKNSLLAAACSIRDLLLRL
jgi:hypothetical protein